MPWIINVSYSNIINGDHLSPNETDTLIQIVDSGIDFPIPHHNFGKIYAFEFSDVDENDDWGTPITNEQAEQLVSILTDALQNNNNVVVHCIAGVCRSGAVAEIGIMMGFNDMKTHRIPNRLVKTKMMKVLGWSYE